MQSHNDERSAFEFINKLEQRAKDSMERQLSQITGGKPGEEVLCEWHHDGMRVTKRPDDEQGILRISIGGGKGTPVPMDYCVIRGNVYDCLELLNKARAAIASEINPEPQQG